MTDRLLAFDGRTGASGDMLLATLLDAGADPATLEPVERALDIEYRIDSTTSCGIHATTVDVVLTDDRADDASDDPSATSSPGSSGEPDTDGEGEHEHKPGDEHGQGDAGAADDDGHDDGHGHARDHHHHHQNGHSHDHTHHDHHTPAEGHGPHRSYLEVRSIVESMNNLDPAVEASALAIFERLANAEAAVHGADLESIHFHEVGADDAIADIVGVALLVSDLDVDRIVTTPVSVGGGTVSMSHGEYPIPAPAVLEIARAADWAFAGGPVEAELLTPTGAAILAHFAAGVESLPTMSVTESGYGAGGYDLDPHPNVLRALVGTARGGLERDDIAVLETNLDDVAPEVLGGLQETLGAVGARDVSIVPVTMKKSRPGHLVKVICKPADRERVARRLAEETGTLGIRDAGVTHRWIANRSFETVSIDLEGEAYDVTVKIASDTDGEVYDISAEYDDVAAVARETGVSLQDIASRAEERCRQER